MRLGFLSGRVEDIEKAGRIGFTGIELNANAFRGPNPEEMNSESIHRAKELCHKHNVEITAIAYYELAGTQPSISEVVAGYERAFDLADELGVSVVASMSGFNPERDWKGNVQLFAERFGPVAELAESRGMKVAFENWMGFGARLPFKPVNMGGSPDTWDAWFEAVPSEALGIEFDPSHLYWQGIDHIRALREYASRVYHVHAKDTELYPERRYRGGVNGNYFQFRIPGYGEIHWPRFISTLDEIGYDGGVAIEHEDFTYWNERFDEGLVRGWQTLYPLVHPKS